MGYSFPGVRPFVDRVAAEAGPGIDAGRVAGDEHVRRAGDLIAGLGHLAPGEEGSREEVARGIEEAIGYHEHCIAAIEAMASEAFPHAGLKPVRAAFGRRAVSNPAPSAIGDDPDALASEPIAGPDGRPLTIDPKNPEHQQYLDKIPKYGSVDPGHLARMQSAANKRRRAAVGIGLHPGAAAFESEILGPTRPPGASSSLEISADSVDAEYDAWVRSPEGRARLASAGAAASREAYYRAVGADVGLSGGPPRPDTGVNQDFNQRDAPTQFDKPDQSIDPFQQKNPPYTEPNETGYGTQGVKRPQGPMTGSGLHPAAIAAQARVPHEQAGEMVPGDQPVDVRGHVPPEAKHPEFGGGTGADPGKPASGGGKPKGK